MLKHTYVHIRVSFVYAYFVIIIATRYYAEECHVLGCSDVWVYYKLKFASILPDLKEVSIGHCYPVSNHLKVMQ
jgi:hypothetical protein